RDVALAAGREEPQLGVDLLDPFLHRAANGRRHAARMPVEPEDAAERLKPERIGEPAQDVVHAVLARQIDDDFARQPHHAAEEPGGRFAAVQRQRCVAGMARHETILCDRSRASGQGWLADDDVTDASILPTTSSSAAPPPPIQRTTATMSCSQSMKTMLAPLPSKYTTDAGADGSAF